jgi:hypothetical protein
VGVAGRKEAKFKMRKRWEHEVPLSSTVCSERKYVLTNLKIQVYENLDRHQPIKSSNGNGWVLFLFSIDMSESIALMKNKSQLTKFKH